MGEIYICAKSQLISYSSYYCMSVWHCSHLQCIINALPPGHGRPLQGPKSTVRILSLTSLFLCLSAVTWWLVTLSGLSVWWCCPCHLLALQFFCLQRSLLLARGQSWGSLVRLLQVITVADGAGLTECIRTSERPFKGFLTRKSLLCEAGSRSWWWSSACSLGF